MLEKTLERYFVDKIKVNGGDCIKFTGAVGLPDRIVLLPGGKVFFVEFKALGKKPRKVQGYIHRRLQQLGFNVYVVDDKAKAEEVCDEWNLSLMTTKSKQ